METTTAEKTETLATKTRKEYTYNFIDGGWNSEFAYTKLEAYKQAVERWTKEGSLDLASRVDKKSFRIATEAETKNLLSMFW